MNFRRFLARHARISLPRATRPTPSGNNFSFSTLSYQDDYIKDILKDTKVIAMVGASTNWNRPSYFAMKYLQAKGFRVIPINPMAAGKGDGTLLGEKIYANLDDIPDDLKGQVDMVDIFRRPSDVGPIVQESLQRLPELKTVWMQLEVVNEEAAALAEENGLNVVMDRCPKIEFSRLFGELGWHGFNSKVISSKRRKVGGDGGDGASKGDGTKPTFDGFATRTIHAGKFLFLYKHPLVTKRLTFSYDIHPLKGQRHARRLGLGQRPYTRPRATSLTMLTMPHRCLTCKRLATSTPVSPTRQRQC